MKTVEQERAYQREYYRVKGKKRRRAYYYKNVKRIKARDRAYYKKNAARIAIRNRKYREANWIKLVVRFTARRARKAGIPFDLVPGDLTVPKRCPILGIEIKIGERYSHNASPSLDRINPRKGYVRGNVAVISMLANIMKGNASAAQHRRIADWIDEQVPT